jgi:hypothetical protein
MAFNMHASNQAGRKPLVLGKFARSAAFLARKAALGMTGKPLVRAPPSASLHQPTSVANPRRAAFVLCGQGQESRKVQVSTHAHADLEMRKLVQHEGSFKPYEVNR